jgi:hypothetical protein
MKEYLIKKGKEKFKIQEYTFDEWMEKFRPDGKGRIGIGVPGDMEVIEFDEIICDYCNAEITADDKFIWVNGSYSLCEKCFEEYRQYIVKEGV